MKKLIKVFGILLLPLLVVAGYAVPQIAFAGGGSFDAQTVLNFIEYTPDVPTPTPTPVDPSIIPTGTAQTGDFMLACIGIFAIAAAVSVAIFLRKMISYNTKSLLAVFCMSMAPLVLAGSCVVGVSNATAARDGALVSPKIDVYVNTQGGPVHYGEGTTSNVQTYTNTTGDMIYINEIEFKVTSENSNVFVGQWTGTLDDGTTIFKGGAGDIYKLDKPIFLNNGESFEVTWETETQSEDLMDCIGTAPVSICYMTFEAKYTVDFDSNGGSAVPSQTVIYQQKVAKPADPSYPKNSFVYWASDEALANEYDFDTPVTQDMTLYAKWVVDPEYVEEVEEEAAEDAEKAKDDVMDALRGILTQEELELIGDDIDELLADFKADIEQATTPEEVDQAKKDFEKDLLNIEKGALKDGSDKQEQAAEDDIDDVPGLSTTDIGRYKKMLQDKKDETNSKIDAASNFEDAKKEQQKFEPSAESIINEATELGETKNEARDTSEEATDDAKTEIDECKGISESTKTKYKAKLDKIKEDTDKGIDDATNTDKVAEVLGDQTDAIDDILAEIQEIVETREEIKAEGKQLMSDKQTEVNNLDKVKADLKEKAIKDITDLYTAYEAELNATDDVDEMNDLKDEFEAQIKKIVDDITAINTAIKEGQSELNTLAKQEDEKISLRTDINANDKKELQAGIADLNSKGQDAIAESVSVQEVNDKTASYKQDINTYVKNIVVVNLVVSETTAAHFEDPKYPKVPISTKASQKSTADTVNLDIVITGQKKRVSSVVDDKGGTYQVNDGAISVIFTGNFSTITATIEDIPDEPYAYINDTNDTLTFVYDEHRSDKTTTTFDVLDTSAGVPWTQQMSSASATIQKVAFEASFNTEEAAPVSTANWFKQNDNEAKRPLLKIEGLQNLNTSKIKNAESMFKNVMASQIDGMENWDLSLCTSFSSMFEGCAKLVQTPDFSKWKVNAGKTFSHMFSGCIALSACPDISSWKSESYQVSMHGLFKDCRSIKDFSNMNNFEANTVSGVRDLFNGCSSMEKTPDLSEWNFGESVDMMQMFNRCSSLSDASSLKNWKFNNVSSMYCAFQSNTNLKNLDLSTWTSTGSGVNYQSAFAGCTSLDEVDITLLHFSTTSQTGGKSRTDYGMFSGCSNLRKILTDEYGSGVLTEDNSANMFFGCKSLPHYDDTKIDYNNAFPNNGERGYFTPKHPNITLTFAEGSKGHFEDSNKQTITEYMKKDGDTIVKVMPIAETPGEVVKLVEDNNLPNHNTYQIGVDGFIELKWDANFTIKATTGPETEPYAYLNEAQDTLTFTYDGDRETKGTTFDVEDTSAGVPWKQYMTDTTATIQNVVIDASFKNVQPKTIDSWFEQNEDVNYRKLLNITGLEYINTSKVTKMYYVFMNASKLQSIEGISGWNTSKVQEIYRLFHGCSSLNVSPDISAWNLDSLVSAEWVFSDCSNIGSFNVFTSAKDTKSLKSLMGMFSGCSKAGDIKGLSYLDVSSLENTNCMFFNTSNLKSVPDVTQWKAPKLVNIGQMFRSSAVPGTLDLSNLTTSSALVTTTYMFCQCPNLKVVNMNNFVFTEETNTEAMFAGDTYLETIYYDEDISQILPEAHSVGMFSECNNLTNFVDGESGRKYAYPDNGKTGYFTAEKPIVKFGDLGTDGYFSYPDSEEPLTEYVADYIGEDVYIVVHVTTPGLVISSVQNNAGASYQVDSKGKFLVKCDACYTITATLVEEQPYALLTSSTNGEDDVLKFVCDGNRGDYEEDATFDVLDVTDQYPGWYDALAGDSPTVTKVIIEQSFQKARPKYLNNWFAQSDIEQLRKLTTISGLQNINTSETVTFSHTFYGCSAITNLDFLKGWTIPEDTYGTMFSGMFQSCNNIQSFDGFGPDSNIKVSSSSDMFSGCSNLKSVDIRALNFTTNSVTQFMFQDCPVLENIYFNEDLRSTISASSSTLMFDDCINLPNFNAAVTNVQAAYPNDGVGGYFTADPATVTLGDFAGKYYAEDGTTELGPTISGELGTTMKVMPVASESGKVAKGAIDNTEYIYTLDEDGCFTVTFNANYTITAQVGSETTEAYAALTSSENGENDTLEFWCDENRWMYETTFDIADTENPQWNDCMRGTNPTITKVNIDSSFAYAKPVRTSYWFAQNSDSSKQILSEINGLDHINTTDVTQMNNMFFCSSLSSIDGIGGWNVKKVQSFKNMFGLCSKLENLSDLSSWRLDEATNISYMFQKCPKLTNVSGMSYWEAKKLNNMEVLFSGDASLLTCPDLSNWNLNNVVSATSMFEGCSKLTSIPNIEKWSIEKLFNCSSMFSACDGLTGTIDLSSWKFSTGTNLVFSQMFYNSPNISKIDISSVSFTSTTVTKSMFYGCTALTKIYSDSDARVVLPSNSSSMFAGCSNLHNFDSTKDLDSTYAFPDTGTEGYFTSKHPTIQLTGLGTDGHFENSNKDTITEITGELGSSTVVFAFVDTPGKSISKLEDNAGNSYELDNTQFTVKFDYSYTITATLSTEQPYALLTSSTNGEDDVLKFVYDGNRGDYDAGHTFDVENLTGQPGWYQAIAGDGATITSVIIDESFKKAKPKYLNYWFAQNITPSLRMLTSISGLENIDTSETESFSHTFYGCSAITNLDFLKGWTIPEDTYGTMFSGMFQQCNNIQSFDGFSSDSNIKVSSSSDMFSGCSNLKSVDIRALNFTTSSVTQFMFQDCSVLENIYFDEDLRSTISESSSALMFYGCNNLPNFDAAVTNVQAAFPNDGVGGYFTSKTPTIQLTGLGSDGVFYKLPEKQQVDQVSGDYRSKVSVEARVTNDDKMIDFIKDNAGNTYEFDPENGDFEVTFNACYTITVALVDKLSPKAVYDSNNKSFTFYYDDVEHSGAGLHQYKVINTSWSIEQGSGAIAQWQTKCSDPTGTLNWPTVNDGVNPETIVFDESFKNTTKDAEGNNFTSMSFWFCDMFSVKSVSGLKWIPESVTDISGVFSKFEGTEETLFSGSVLDLTDLKTANVTNVDYFLNGTWFETVTLPNTFAPNATKFSSYIQVGEGIYSLGAFANMKTSTLNIPGTVGGAITNASLMFCGSNKLASLDLPSTKLDLSMTAKTTLMFANCDLLTSVNLEGQTMPSLTTSVQMFNGDANLTTIITKASWNNLEGLVNSTDMFAGCVRLPHYNAEVVDKTYAYPDNGESGYFASVPKEAKAVYTESDKTLTFYYDSDSHAEGDDIFTNIKPSGWDSPFASRADSIETVTFDDNFQDYKELDDIHYWFYNFTKLSTINNFENLYTNNVTNMMRMLYGTKIINLDFSRNNFSSLDRNLGFAGVCQACSELVSASFPDDVSSDANCNYMFKGCSKLTTVNAGGLPFTAVQDPAFGGCSSFTKISTSIKWAVPLSSLLGETEETGYSNWEDKYGTVKNSHDISGNAEGDVYTKAVPKTAKAVYNDGTLTFYYDSETHQGVVYEVPTGAVGESPFADVKRTTTKVEFTEGFYDFQSITNLQYWFQDFTNLTEVVGISYLYTNNVVSMMETFNGTEITWMDLSGNNLNSLQYSTGLTRAFANCKSLRSLKFPVTNIKDDASIKELAYNCTALEEISFGRLECSYGDNENGALGLCTSLTKVSANNYWKPYLSGMLHESQASYSNWTNSAGETLSSNQIEGSDKGDTYTRVAENVNNSTQVLDNISENILNPALDTLFDLLAVIFKVAA